jgi:curved DNA-binding protein CbpA
MNSCTLYDLLQIDPRASPEEVQRAYRARARVLHPDLPTGSSEQMREIIEAFEILSDPLRRANYDRRLDLRNRKTNTMNSLATDALPNQDAPLPMDEAPLVPRMFAQLGIFVLDGSGSMLFESPKGGTKGGVVNTAIRDVFARFQISDRRDNFLFALVSFDTAAKEILPVTLASSTDSHSSYDPTVGHGGGTFVGAGLKEAQRIAETFLAQADPAIPASVVIIALTDGECGNPSRTLEIATKVKENSKITLCATHFATKGQSNPAAQDLLRQIVSDSSTGYLTTYDAESIRKFFEASVTAGVRVN